MQNLISGLHIFNDDKFIDTAIALFEELESNQEYYVIVPNSEYVFKHVKSPKAKKIVLDSTKSFESFTSFINKSDYSVVYFHALDRTKRKLLKNLSHKLVLVWFIWGYDLYNAWPVLQEKIYLKNTLRYINRNRNNKVKVKNKLKKSYLSYRLFLYLYHNKYGFFTRKIYALLANTHKTYYEAVKKISIVVPVVEDEMKWIDKMKLPAKFAPFRYVYLEQLLGFEYKNQKNVDGGNILVGNSAAPSSNHIETFQALSQLNLNNRKIYVPLSYGGNTDYKNLVIEKGKKLLGGNFHPLVHFMPIEEYTNIISSCGILIFNHIRQQGVGNIVAMGYLGAKIYLHKKSPVYSYFKNIGLTLFSMDQLTQKSLDVSLSNLQIEKNKIVLERQYGFSEVVSKVRKLEEMVDQEVKKNEKQ